MFKIGNVALKNNVFLAPMAGVTDLAFRLICDKYGCGLSYTEMVSSKALSFKSKKTKSLLDTSSLPSAAQIFGSDADIMASSIREVEECALLVDINMGCPAPKIVNNGEGSALMKDLNKAEKIIDTVVKNASKPITVKMRAGWDENSKNAVELAKIAEKCGASAITIHGRTREQFYSGKSDNNIIKAVKNAVHIPVIGNGDIFSAADAKNMIDTTGVDAVMIARGAQGNPWIFKECIALIEDGEVIPPPSDKERIIQAIEHIDLLIKYKGEHIGVLESRKHAAWYIKGMPGSARIRDKINISSTFEEMSKLLLDMIQ